LVIAKKTGWILVDQEIALENHRFLHTLSQNHNVDQFDAGEQAEQREEGVNLLEMPAKGRRKKRRAESHL
jgi:hypothetical protein